MSLLPRLCLVLALVGLVQGCQLAAPGGGAGQSDGVTPNAVAGDPIEVTALDAPAAAAPPAAMPAAVPTAEAASTAAPQAAPPEALAPEAVAAAGADPAPLPEDAEAEAPLPEAVAPPAPPKSEAQLTCERKKGRWVPVGSGILKTCIFETRDGGTQCDRESDCEGACLARSGTCSPVTPLLGCHEILQDNGARVTQCIE